MKQCNKRVVAFLSGNNETLLNDDQMLSNIHLTTPNRASFPRLGRASWLVNTWRCWESGPQERAWELRPLFLYLVLCITPSGCFCIQLLTQEHTNLPLSFLESLLPWSLSPRGSRLWSASDSLRNKASGLNNVAIFLFCIFFFFATSPNFQKDQICLFLIQWF